MKPNQLYLYKGFTFALQQSLELKAIKSLKQHISSWLLAQTESYGAMCTAAVLQTCSCDATGELTQPQG